MHEATGAATRDRVVASAADDIVIRAVQPGDAAGWRRLRDLLWEGDDHAAQIDAFFDGTLDEPDDVLVAVDAGGRVVAHVELSLRDDVAGLEGVRTGYIEGLYVDAMHRHSGLTQQLLRASEAWVMQQCCAAFASDRDDRVVVHRRFDGRGATAS